jgi:hypothetical protein
LNSKASPAADDVFLFLAVAMGRGGHALSRKHEFLAVFGLLGEIDENEPEVPPIAKAKVCHIPARMRREGPSMSFKTGFGGPDEGVYFASFHGAFAGGLGLNAWLVCRKSSGEPWIRIPKTRDI